VRGFNEQGTTTTPFDMVVLNRMSRFHLAREVLRRASRRVAGWDELASLCDARLAEHETYVREHLKDLPDIAHWTWQGLAR
jgi:xylulose-5-phosphate/fructose-6-phosphate phosphoketolase